MMTYFSLEKQVVLEFLIDDEVLGFPMFDDPRGLGFPMYAVLLKIPDV
jgi:hypothetical protein